jgi:hypothetical protein
MIHHTLCSANFTFLFIYAWFYWCCIEGRHLTSFCLSGRVRVYLRTHVFTFCVCFVRVCASCMFVFTFEALLIFAFLKSVNLREFYLKGAKITYISSGSYIGRFPRFMLHASLYITVYFIILQKKEIMTHMNQLKKANIKLKNSILICSSLKHMMAKTKMTRIYLFTWYPQGREKST